MVIPQVHIRILLASTRAAVLPIVLSRSTRRFQSQEIAHRVHLALPLFLLFAQSSPLYRAIQR